MLRHAEAKCVVYKAVLSQAVGGATVQAQLTVEPFHMLDEVMHAHALAHTCDTASTDGQITLRLYT